MRHLLLIPAAIAVLAGSAAGAQGAAEPKVNQLIVYGDDKCPESTDDTITVCARKDESERYRIPEELRESSAPSNESWTSRVRAYETVGRTGATSCSPVGPGGWTGCAGKLIDAAYAERKSGPNSRFSQLIAAERAKRLATIDQQAAETQASVEQSEKDYEAQQKANAAAPAAPAAATAPPATTPTTPPADGAAPHR